MESKLDQEYWRDHWQAEKFSIAPQHHPIRQWIESEVAQTTDADVFEVGCYPGKFLAVFGEKGYTLNGIDCFSEKYSTMQNWFKDEGYKVGQFYQSDFFGVLPAQQYDIVCSFGFIEHFEDWPEALSRHVGLIKAGGHIMIDVPNLKSPLYYLLYKILEPRVLKNHYLSVMNIDAISDVLEKNGCTVKTATYLGYFYFRFVTHTNKLSLVVTKCINLLRPLFELLPKSVYMRYIVVSAVKQAV